LASRRFVCLVLRQTAAEFCSRESLSVLRDPRHAFLSMRQVRAYNPCDCMRHDAT
jgi:hypothetical protein